MQPAQASEQPQDQPDPALVVRLMTQFRGRDMRVSRRAMRRLVAIGCPIRDLIASGEFNILSGSGRYSLCELVDVINEVGMPDIALTGLAQAVVGPGGNIRSSAVYVCEHLGIDHPLVLNALARSLHDWRDNVRLGAARALLAIRASTPDVIGGLVAALKDTDYEVVECAMKALGAIRASTPQVLTALVAHLVPSYGEHCWRALCALESIGAFDPVVLRALRQLATSTFSYPRPPQCGSWSEEYSEWGECSRRAEADHRECCQKAASVLHQLIEPLLQPGSPGLVGDREAPLSPELRNKLKRMFEIELERKAWDWLKVFYHVGKAGSYTAAANTLEMVNASGPLKSIAAFQACLEVRLLESRRPKGIVLTTDGKLLWEWAKYIFEPQHRLVRGLGESGN